MSSSVVALAPIFALVTLVNSAVADPSELAKPPADITKHASEMIKRIEKDLCAMQSDHRPEPTKTLVGPLCTDLEQMNKQTLADMELIQRHLDKTLTAHSSRQRDIDMFTFYRDHYPFDTSDPDPAAIQIQLEGIRLAILFSKSSKVIETITSKTPENESLKAPSVQFILRSLTESLVQIKKLQPDQAKSPYKYNTEEIEILKKASQTKQNSPKLSSTELSVLQSIIASFPVQKGTLPDLKEAERYFLKELEAAKKMLAESPEGDPNATLHWLAKKKSIAIRARLPKYIDCSLSPSDVLALSYYTGSGYASINSALRKPENKRSELERKIAAAVTPSLNAALDKLKPYIGIVRRGAALPEDVLAEHKIVGHTIEYKSYVSTSLGLGWQRPHLFVIHSRTGRYVAPYSSSYGEAEVLFKPGTKFKVLEVVEEGPVTKFVLDEVVE